jgi:hypothetical protein
VSDVGGALADRADELCTVGGLHLTERLLAPAVAQRQPVA